MTVSPTVLPRVHRQAATRLLLRELAFPLLAAVFIVVSADIRMPIGLPGHRGLIWLTLLVAVGLATRRAETVLSVGAASTVATLVLHTAPGPWASARYLGAAVLLYALLVTAAARRRRWLIALTAAPIHLVALAGSVAALIGGGHLYLLATVGLGQKALFHLGFGLLAGLFGWAIAVGMDRVLPADPR